MSTSTSPGALCRLCGAIWAWRRACGADGQLQACPRRTRWHSRSMPHAAAAATPRRSQPDHPPCLRPANPTAAGASMRGSASTRRCCSCFTGTTPPAAGSVRATPALDCWLLASRHSSSLYHYTLPFCISCPVCHVQLPSLPVQPPFHSLWSIRFCSHSSCSMTLWARVRELVGG